MDDFTKIKEEGYDELLDVRGLFCPEPIMLLHNKIRNMSTGQILSVMATDPTTQRDVPQFCQFLEHELLLFRKEESLYRYAIRKYGKKGKSC